MTILSRAAEILTVRLIVSPGQYLDMMFQSLIPVFCVHDRYFLSDCCLFIQMVSYVYLLCCMLTYNFIIIAVADCMQLLAKL